jgi:acyl-CoA thioester hydrolase
VPEDGGPNALSLIRLRVRFSETDLMGIVHHGSYLTYMELARVEWLRRRGVTYAAWAERHIHLAVAEVALKYRAPARFDELLAIETRLTEVGAATVRFGYRIVRAGDGVLCVEGSTRLAHLDERLALRRLTPEMIEALGRKEQEGLAARETTA